MTSLGCSLTCCKCGGKAISPKVESSPKSVRKLKNTSKGRLHIPRFAPKKVIEGGASVMGPVSLRFERGKKLDKKVLSVFDRVLIEKERLARAEKNLIQAKDKFERLNAEKKRLEAEQALLEKKILITDSLKVSVIQQLKQVSPEEKVLIENIVENSMESCFKEMNVFSTNKKELYSLIMRDILTHPTILKKVLPLQSEGIERMEGVDPKIRKYFQQLIRDSYRDTEKFRNRVYEEMNKMGIVQELAEEICYANSTALFFVQFDEDHLKRLHALYVGMDWDLVVDWNKKRIELTGGRECPKLTISEMCQLVSYFFYGEKVTAESVSKYVSEFEKVLQRFPQYKPQLREAMKIGMESMISFGKRLHKQKKSALTGKTDESV